MQVPQLAMVRLDGGDNGRGHGGLDKRRSDGGAPFGKEALILRLLGSQASQFLLALLLPRDGLQPVKLDLERELRHPELERVRRAVGRPVGDAPDRDLLGEQQRRPKRNREDELAMHANTVGEPQHAFAHIVELDHRVGPILVLVAQRHVDRLAEIGHHLAHPIGICVAAGEQHEPVDRLVPVDISVVQARAVHGDVRRRERIRLHLDAHGLALDGEPVVLHRQVVVTRDRHAHARTGKGREAVGCSLLDRDWLRVQGEVIVIIVRWLGFELDTLQPPREVLRPGVFAELRRV